MAHPPKVFISYSHDNEKHEQRVLQLASRLRNDGVDAEIDQYEDAPKEGWPQWCERQIERADFVLMVCTETYLRRVRGEEEAGKGLGVPWEAQIVRSILYNSASVSRRFIPVLFSDGSIENSPVMVRNFTRHQVDAEDGYDKLYRQLTNQPAVRKPALGQLRPLPPKEPKPAAGEAARAAVGVAATPPRRVFRDIEAPWCPEMVELPLGEFMMGSPDGHRFALARERPQHLVRIAYQFALNRHTVTFEQYDTFCTQTNRRKLNDEGWGRGRRPAINVGWQDAQDYVAWLSVVTGESCRLPSEAEWEFGCRAGTTTLYNVGDKLTNEHAHFGGKTEGTSEVGAYTPNAWGLYDMHGNVWEWVEDVWHDNYVGAPTDGSAWNGEWQVTRPCHRVCRGGCWKIFPLVALPIG